jgi:hypothetical protein
MDHWALLMMKDPEEPHLFQATSLSSISWHTHHARSQERYMPCRLLVLILRGGPTAPRFPCPCVLAAGAGGTALYRG